MELCADVVFSEHFIKLCSDDVLCCILTLENVYLGTRKRHSNVCLILMSTSGPEEDILKRQNTTPFTFSESEYLYGVVC